MARAACINSSRVSDSSEAEGTEDDANGEYFCNICNSWSPTRYVEIQRESESDKAKIKAMLCAAERSEDEIDEQEENENIRVAKKAQVRCTLFTALWDTKIGYNEIQPPDNSLFAASITMPMVARTSGYQLSYVASSLNMMLQTLSCIFLQFCMLDSLAKARTGFPDADGVPRMCTYGQDPSRARAPHGPAGVTFERGLGNIEPDATMFMVRNTMYEMLKSMNVSNDGIGPVEYGMESASCRFVCVGVFVIAVLGDIHDVLRMAQVVLKVPTLGLRGKEDVAAESLWIDIGKIRKDDKGADQPLKNIAFRANGMPWWFKIFWAWPILLANSIVLASVFWNGWAFLMNTGGIIDLILNSLALTFIVELEETMFTAFARDKTKALISQIGPYQCRIADDQPIDFPADWAETEWKWGPLALLRRYVHMAVFPLISLLLIVASHYAYFFLYCENQRLPFDFTRMFSRAYFEDTSTYFGGFEFFFGSWRSGDVFSHGQATCIPAKTDAAGVRSFPQGCMLPQPWNPSP